jgi:hypothetical protein
MSSSQSKRRRHHQGNSNPQTSSMTSAKATVLLTCFCAALWSIVCGIILFFIGKLPEVVGAIAGGITALLLLIVGVFGPFGETLKSFIPKLWQRAHKRFSILFGIGLITLIALAVGFFGPSSSGSLSTDGSSSVTKGLYYTVKNTSETLPDGVYFRHSLQADPSHPTPTPIYGFGVFKNDEIQVSCWARGDEVSGDRLWYYVSNVTRPTVAERSNKGWISAHYVNDGMTVNQAAPHIPQCSNPLPTGG